MDDQKRHEKFFCTKQLSDNLALRSVRGGLVTVGSQGLSFVLGLGRTMVLARLLMPDDFGLVAMVGVVVGFATMFKDAGLSMATVQQKEVDHQQVSTLFWFNVALSALLGLLLGASAPAVAWFFGRSELTYITLVLAGTFLLSGLTIQHQALLRRRMRFGALAVIAIFSQVVSMGVGIVTAWLGWGYWALVIMSVAYILVSLIGTWIACPWIPGLPVKGAGVRKMLKFGGNLTGFSVANYFARNMDKLLIGKFIGAGPLGIYSKAYALLMFPLQQINAPMTAVALPALSRLQGQPERYRRYCMRALSLILIVALPLMTFLAVFSDHVILVVLGPKWQQASTVFMFLAIAGLYQPLASAVGWLFISQDRVNELLRWGVFASSISVASFAVGLYWGVVGVAASYALTGLIIRMPILLWYATRRGPVRLVDVATSATIPLCASLVVGASLVLLRLGLGEINPLGGLALALLVAAVGVFGVLFGSQRGRYFFRESISPVLLLLWSKSP